VTQVVVSKSIVRSAFRLPVKFDTGGIRCCCNILNVHEGLLNWPSR
jgi:hypothetical protein